MPVLGSGIGSSPVAEMNIHGASHFAPFTAIDTFHRIVSIFLRGEPLPQEAWDP